MIEPISSKQPRGPLPLTIKNFAWQALITLLESQRTQQHSRNIPHQVTVLHAGKNIPTVQQKLHISASSTASILPFSRPSQLPNPQQENIPRKATSTTSLRSPKHYSQSHYPQNIDPSHRKTHPKQILPNTQKTISPHLTKMEITSDNLVTIVAFLANTCLCSASSSKGHRGLHISCSPTAKTT